MSGNKVKLIRRVTEKIMLVIEGEETEEHSIVETDLSEEKLYSHTVREM